MLNILRNFSVIVAILIFASCNIKDNSEDCGVYLEFRYDYNMEYTDMFKELIETVNVYVFDSQGKFLLHKYSPSSQLINGNIMQLQDGLPFGKYTILAVGGLSNDFNLLDIYNNQFVVGVTTIESLKLELKRKSNIVSNEFKNIWIGDLITLDYRADKSVWRVNFIQNTNTFDITLRDTETHTIEPISAAPYTFELVTPEGGAYGPDNSHLFNESVTYKPYLLIGGSTSIISQGYIKTMRLLSGFSIDSYKLVVRKVSSGEKTLEYDLMTLLIESKPTYRPDNTLLPMQEYLDRQSEYKIEVIVENRDGGLNAVAIKINGWIVWLNDIGV